MRSYATLGIMILMITAFVVACTPSSSQGQFPGGGKGAKGGKGKKGGFQGQTQDPSAQFDLLANGRPYIVIAESRFSFPLTQYAQQKGITNGQITREQYLEFTEQMRSRPGNLFGGKGKKGFAPNNQAPVAGTTATPGAVNTAVPQQSPDFFSQWADDEFRRADTNGDGKLNADEVRGPLRENLSRWDTNRDGLIDQLEFRAYFRDRRQNSEQDGNKAKQPNAIAIIIEEEELDRKIVVFRAGKLPKDGLPPWFSEFDTNNDGQVALYEWRAKGKSHDDFAQWDTNDDGFITPEEAMKQLSVSANVDPSKTLANAGGMNRKKGGNGGDRTDRTLGGNGAAWAGNGGGWNGNANPFGGNNRPVAADGTTTPNTGGFNFKGFGKGAFGKGGDRGFAKKKGNN